MISEEIWTIQFFPSKKFKIKKPVVRDSLNNSHIFQSRDTMAKDAFSPLGGGGGHLDWGDGA